MMYENTLTTFYKTHFNTLVNKIRRHTLNVEDAEEIVQETFIRMLKNLHKFDPDKSSFATWANLLLFSCLWDKKRRDKNQPVIINADLFGELELLEDYEDFYKKYFHQLGGYTKSAVVRFYLLGYSVEEIAHADSKSASTVRKIIQRYQQ